jgi:hypothetical protein
MAIRMREELDEPYLTRMAKITLESVKRTKDPSIDVFTQRFVANLFTSGKLRPISEPNLS